MAQLPPVVSGLTQILRNMRRAQNQIGSGVERGLKVAGAMLLKESQKRVPVDLGNLKASGYVRKLGKGFNTRVNVGYTASYALYVHENQEIWPPGMRLKGQPRGAEKKGQKGYRGRYWDPQGRAQPKFLEGPAREMGPQLRAVIRQFGKIK